MNTTSRDRSTILSDEAIHWLVQLRAGAADETTRRRFADWLAQSPEHARAFEETSRLWERMVESLARDDAAFRMPRAVPTVAHKARRKRALSALAAALLLALGLGYSGAIDRWLSDYATATGEQRQIELTDGSHVLLNTDSAIAMDSDRRTRRVRLLRGQAVFQVAADASRPFEVVADDAAVRALGTVFEVALNRGGGISVVVQEHAVGIRPSGDDAAAAIRVAQGQRLDYRGAPAAEPEPVDLNETSAWQRGKLIWKERPLAQVVAELNRYRSGKILIADAKLASMHVSGVFSLEDPDATLNAVETALDIHSTRLSSWLVMLHS